MNQSVRLILAVVFAILIPASSHGQAQTAPRPLKILMIGNSFTGNAVAYLPRIAEAGGKKLEIFTANPGGCSLEKHAGFLKAYEANPNDPAGSPYSSSFYPSRNEPKTRKYSLREALESNTWDYVSLQQFSEVSYKAGSYEPYAGILVAYIHKYAPNARIVIFQTWAYREDYMGFGKDGFTQQKMYDLLTQNYEKLAADYHAAIIPVGYAFQNARDTERWHFKYPDPNFNYKNPPEGGIPSQPGSLNAGWGWYKPPAGGKPSFVLDQKHCNDAGKLLTAAVFYEALFQDDVTKNSFVPPKMDARDAADLRRIAHESVASYQPRKPVDQKTAGTGN